MSKIAVVVAAIVAVGIAAAVFHAGTPLSSAGVQIAQQDGADGEKKKKKRRTLVDVDQVRIVPMAQTLPLVGRLVAIRSGVVASRIDAPVAEMRVDIGDSVSKGDVLATLVNDRLKWDREQKAAELAAAQATVATAKARLALAEQELKRFQKLETSAAFSKARFEDKRLEVARLRTEIVEAQARVKKSQAVLRLAETELAYTRILAPYEGTITRRHTEIGAFVKEGDAVYTMVSDRDLEVEVHVPAGRIGALQPGTVAEFELGADGKRFEAAVRAIVPEEDPRTRTRTVRFRPKFDVRPSIVAANQSATVHVPLGAGRKLLSVHKDAVIMVQGVPTTFAVEDGRARARTVSLGESVGQRFEVKDGLKQGDIVVTRGNERLRDGERVRHNGTPTQ